MGTLVGEFGRRVMERWAALLVLPGLLYVLAAAAARTLGHDSFTDIGRLVDAIRNAAANATRDPSLLAIAAVLLPVLAAVAGLLARTAGALAGRLWFGPWPAPLSGAGGRLAAARARRWTAASSAYTEAMNRPDAPGPAVRGERQRELDTLAARRNSIGLRPPVQPTWMADRLSAADARVWAWYRLDVAFAWPRLWLLLTPEEQSAIRESRIRVDAATTLAGWSVLYFALGYWYWPAALLGPCLFTAAWWQARPAVDTFAHLTEAVFDLHAADLARAVGLEPSAGQFSPSLGLEVTAVLRKQA